MLLVTPYKVRLNILNNSARGTWKEISKKRSSVNLKDNFMKFQENLHRGLSRQDQKHFSPGGTLGGQFTLLSEVGQFYNQMRTQYRVRLQQKTSLGV